MIQLSSLKPLKGNPRRIGKVELQRLTESIKRDSKFMTLSPLIVDEHNTVIAGNQRLKALKELGYKTVPEEWVKYAKNLTEEEKKRFIVIDNSPEGMSGHFDLDILKSGDWDVPGLTMDIFGIELPAFSEQPEILDFDETDEGDSSKHRSRMFTGKQITVVSVSKFGNFVDNDSVPYDVISKCSQEFELGASDELKRQAATRIAQVALEEFQKWKLT